MKQKSPLKVFYPFPEDLACQRARAIQALNTAAAIAETGAEVTLFVEGEEGVFEHLLSSFYGIEKPDSLRMEFLSREKKILGVLPVHSNRFFYSRFLDAAGTREPDCVFCRHLKPAATLLRDRPFGNTPVVFEAHDIFHLSFREEFDIHGLKNGIKYHRAKKREGFVYANTDSVVAITASLAGRIREEFKVRTPAHVVPDGTAFAGRFTKKKLDLSDNRIFYLGSFHPWKGVRSLIYALQFPGMGELVLVGPISDAQRTEITRLAERQGVSGRVSLREAVAPSKMESLLAEINFAAIPNTGGLRSRLFTSPLKLFDYMAAGAAVIASDLPSIREIIGREPIGWAEAEDPESIALAFRGLKENPEQTHGTAALLKERAVEYSWAMRGRRIHEVLSGVSS